MTTPTLNPKITAAGLALFPSPNTGGFQVALTHVAIGTGKYTPTGSETALQAEVARYSIGSGGSSPSPTQVQIGVLITDTDDTGRTPNGQAIGEIGLYAGTTLFAVWSQPSTALFNKTAAFDVPMAYTLDVSILPAGSVTVNVNASKEGLESFILAHEAKADPHPQYVLEKIGMAKYDANTIYDLDARVIGNDGKTYRSLAANNVGFTPSTNAAKWARWGHTVSELHSEFIPTKTGVQVNGTSTTGIVRVTNPDGAWLASAATVTGAIKIAFPAGTNAYNSMVRMRVEVYDQATGEAITLGISGYVTSGLAWSMPTVVILGNKADRDFSVRFGNDGKPCIWIGELASTWDYLRAYVSEVMVSYNSDGGNVDRWDSGWSMSTVTAFDTVASTVSGNLVFAKSDIANVSGLQTALNGKEPTIAVGTTAQYWRGDKMWSDFATDVRGAVLTGLSTATNAVIAATDSVLGALGKLQKQITDLGTSKEGAITAGTTAQFWRGDKTWQDLATSVRGTVLTGLSVATNAVITAADTVLGALGKLQKQITDLDAAKVNTTAVIDAAHGGTGQSSYAVGDILYASTTTALSKLAGVAVGNALIAGGVGAAPSWGKIQLSGTSQHVTGTLGVGNGGTNSTAAPTNGGVAYGTGTAYAFTAAGSAKQLFVANGAAAPSWQTIDMTFIPGATWKKSVRAASTANLTVTATATTLTNSGTLAALVIDGVTPIAGDRLLIKNQTTSAQNGIYDVTNPGSSTVAWVLTRSADADTSAEIAASVVGVDQGTTQGGDLWTTTFKTTDTIGTTSMFWYEELDSGNFSNYAEPKITAGTTAQYLRGDKTWQDFGADVRGAVLTGLSTATNAAIAATDSVLSAFGKLQKQVTDLGTNKEASITAGTTAQFWRGDKTWQDLATAVRAVVLTGLSTATSTAVAATDTVLAAIGKLQAQLNLKAPLDSPPLTGNPTAPTPAQFDNDTSIATTAFVQRALGNYQLAVQLAVNAVQTLTAADAGKYFQLQGGTITLPSVTGLQPGATFTFSSSATTTIKCNAAGDSIFVGASGYNSLTISGDSCTITYLSGAAGAAAWEVSSGSAFLDKLPSFIASKAANGYQKLPSGLIIQWGVGTFSNTGTANNFPIAFPSNVYSLTIGNAESTGVSFSISGVSTTGFSGYRSAAGSASAYWIAIGA